MSGQDGARCVWCGVPYKLVQHDEGCTARQGAVFDFDLRLVQTMQRSEVYDFRGAQRITVRAETRASAVAKAELVLGEPAASYRWHAVCDDIREVHGE